MQCTVIYATDVYSDILLTWARMWGLVVIFQTKRGPQEKKV